MTAGGLQGPAHPRRSRRGNYAILFALTAVVLMGFGALAVDISYKRAAEAQAQDVADAASQAAIIALRHTGDRVEAEVAVRDMLRLNSVGTGNATLDHLEFGAWDHVGKSFDPAGSVANSARVSVRHELPYLLAPVLGFENFEVTGNSTSASRNMHVVLSIDITNSWNQADFRYARDAANVFLDTLSQSAGPLDKIGMNVFSGKFAWEFTPLTYMVGTHDDPNPLGRVRDAWSDLRTASKPGKRNGNNCNESTMNNDWFDNPPDDLPPGGCFPHMPREYAGKDGGNCTAGAECGTDHAVGLELALKMFQKEADESAYRALVILTDGQPSGVTPNGTHGQEREDRGYVEGRWPQLALEDPRYETSAVIADSEMFAARLWEEERVHIWVISFVQHHEFMNRLPKGQGYYELTNNASALVPIFRDIANSLPIYVVQ